MRKRWDDEINWRIGLVMVAFLIIVGVVALKSLSKPTASKPVDTNLTPVYCVNGLVPTACIFGIKHSPYIVQSQYSYEANLLDGSTPRGDDDYMLPYGPEEARLPGGKWDKYGWHGAVFVQGSGWVSKFEAPNGGRFAFLHLQDIRPAGTTAVGSISPLNVADLPPLVFPENPPRSGDERTAQAVAQQIGVSSLAAVDYYHGGQIAGLTGWPTSFLFGNGSSGPADGHLCVVLDAKALAWFWKIATGHDTPPFPAKKWGRTAYRDKYGHLLWDAAWTYHHHETSIYPHLKGDRWFGHAPGRQYGFDEYHFHGSALGKVLRCWPHFKKCKLTKS